MKIQTISIMTATGQYNLWDELILEQEYNLIKDKFKDAKYYIFTYDKNSSILEDNNLEYITYFPYNIKKNPIANIGYLIKNIITIYKSDLIVIWWGWLIYDNEKSASDPIKQWKLRVFLAKLFGKKIMYFWLWVSVKREKYSKIKYLFSGKNTYTSVRDKKSLEILNSIWEKARIIDDPVLSKESVQKMETWEKIIWISFRSGFLKNEIQNIEWIVEYLQEKWYKILFITHSFHWEDTEVNDYKFLEKIADKYNINMTETMQETLEAYKYLDFVIGMRLHSVILSIVNTIPYICLSYAKKTEEVNSEIWYNYVLDCKNFEINEFKNMFENLEINESEVKIALKQEYDKIRLRTKFNINNFLNGLE